MKQKTRFKNFGNIGYQYRLSVHEWPIYQYRPQKSHIGRSLVLTFVSVSQVLFNYILSYLIPLYKVYGKDILLIAILICFTFSTFVKH